MKEKPDFVLEKIFGLDFNRHLSEIIEELGEKLERETKLKVCCYKNKAAKKITINYSLEEDEDKITALCTAAGLPTKDFFYAGEIYNQKLDEYGRDYKYKLEGSLAGGALAQYVGVMSEETKIDYKVIGYDSLGLESFLKFKGNEFLGFKMGLLYYLDDLIYKPHKDRPGSQEKIFHALVDEAIIKYEKYGKINGLGEERYQNISSEYRKRGGEELKADKLKEKLYKIFDQTLNLKEEELEELIEANYDPQLIEQKMRFIDCYHLYKNRTKDKQDNIVNYLFSNNPLALTYKHIGTTHIIDQDLKEEEGISKELSKQVKDLKEDVFDQLTKSNFELFEPYILKEKGGNGPTAKNRLGKSPEKGEITNCLSRDYLRALAKDIILDLHKKDESILIKIFKDCRRGSGKKVFKLIKDRLRHSLKLKGRLKESEVTYESPFLEENPDLFTEDDKTYPLDRAVLNHLEERMTPLEVNLLWDWELSGAGIFMILGSKEDEVVEYHTSTPDKKLDTKQKKVKLKLKEPSKNKIYGSLKKRPNYREKFDTEYRVKEDKAYNFSAKEGTGFTLITKHVDPKRKIKLEGEDISGFYKEKERGKAEIGGRNKSLRDKYFGDNIILRDKKRRMGKLSGKLIYLYGPNKEDELIIDGFVNGDYGIELKEKYKKKEKKEDPKLYTPHQIKLTPFEFEILDELEIKKSHYAHSKAVIKGVINEDNHKKYERKLAKDAPKLVINYHNDDTKILFKGIVDEYCLKHERHNYYLELEAVSYTKLLDREKKTRVFQNQGTTYGDVFKKLKEEYDGTFNIVCGDSSLEEKPLVSERHPLILQYKETDWEFLKRISSYLNQPLIVDDMKDDSEVINILVGTHAAAPDDLNNAAGSMSRRKTKDNAVFNHYKVKNHYHFRSDDIFDIGKPINYRDDPSSKVDRELIILKNRIYVTNEQLCSDLVLAAEDKINVRRIKREESFVGISLRGEVKQVNNRHQAQVEFLDVDNEYQEDKAFWFPVDEFYTNAYFAPEVGDVVDVYFKDREEKFAAIKSSSNDNGKETKHPPHLKTITVGGNKIEFDGKKDNLRLTTGEKIYADFNTEEIKFKNYDQTFGIFKDKIKMENKKNKLEINNEEVRIESGESRFVIDKEKAELGCGKKKIKLTKDCIKMP